MRKFGNRYYARLAKGQHKSAVNVASVMRNRGVNARVIKGKHGSTVFVAPRVRRFNAKAVMKTKPAEELFNEDRGSRLKMILEESNGSLRNWGADLMVSEKKRWDQNNRKLIEQAKANRSDYSKKYETALAEARKEFADVGMDFDAPSRVPIEDRTMKLKKLKNEQSSVEKAEFAKNLEKARQSMGWKAGGYLMRDYEVAEMYRRANLLTYGIEGSSSLIKQTEIFGSASQESAKNPDVPIDMGMPKAYGPEDLNQNLALDPSSGAQSLKRFKLGGKKVNYHLFALGYNKSRLQQVSRDLKEAGFSARVVPSGYDKATALRKWSIFIHPTGKQKTQGLKKLYEDDPANPQFGNVMRSLLSSKGFGLGTWNEDGSERGFDIALSDPQFRFTGSENDYQNIYKLDWRDFDDIYTQSSENDFIVLKDKLSKGFDGKAWKYVRDKEESMTARWAGEVNPGPMALNVRVYNHEEKPVSVSFMKSNRPKKKMKATFTYQNGRQKTTHFGGTGYEDFTVHNDADRKSSYLNRHKKNEDWNDPTTAGALSRWILWNKESKNASIEDYKRRFDLNA